jgi:diguanylate cyclase (GGDEF)-like protein/PAS domain S-box-containing protein
MLSADSKSKLRIIKWLVVAVSAAATFYSIARFPTLHLPVPVLFLALVIINIASHIRVRIPLIRTQISLTAILITLTLLLFGVEEAVLVSVLVSLCIILRLRSETNNLLMDVATLPLSTFIVGWMLRLMVGPIRDSGDRLFDALLAVSVIGVTGTLVYFGAQALGCFKKSEAPPWRTMGERPIWTLLGNLLAAIFSVGIANLTWVCGFYPTVGVVSTLAVFYWVYTLSSKARKAESSVSTLRDSMELFRVAFDYASIGMALVSASGRWLRVNRSLCDILGYTKQELLARDFQTLIHPEDVGPAVANINQLLKGNVPTFQTEKRYIHKDGRVVRVLWSVSHAQVEGSDSAHLIFQIQDITDRKQAEERLLHDALHDGLTGLPNRALLIDHLKLTIARSKRNKSLIYAVLFLDLDRFKIVNDSLGHIIGDQLLIGIARRLELCLREGDTVARVGGDEFTILLEDLADEEEAALIAERIQEELKVPFYLGGRDVFTSVSIGIALSSRGYEQPDEILRDADTAMYRAKSLGKARHEVFDEEMHALAVNLLQMETDLRRAYEREEFIVEYQPIVSLTDFRVCGFEALVRWQHPERGLISPLDFIPVAEECGQILQIGEWVLNQACSKMRGWQERFPADPPLFVTVNLSAKQFTQADLIDQVRKCLDNSGLDPNSLKLEITESVVMDNIETATAMLVQLRALGVRLSIDDFGTGYSSLSYLHRFPIDTLKIDRSFVTRIVNDKENIEIVRTILMLAENLGMDVVAEGVETQEQMVLLRDLSCTSGQGYFFSRPMNIQQAEKIIADTYAPPKALVA